MQEKVSKSSRWSTRDVTIISVVVVLFLATVAWAGIIRAQSGDMLREHPLSLSALIIASLIVVVVVTVIWWRNIDEAAREAHKWSWYWGGSAGLCGVLVFFVLVYMTGGALGREAIAAAGLAGRELELGMAIGAFLPVIGYALAWGFWWWKRR